MSPARYRFVCATRESREDFYQRCALGRTLSLYRAPFVEITLFERNRSGLPALYNRAIRESAGNPAILIFIHDDVHICDFFWPVQIAAGLRIFDVIGLAGTKRRLPRQPAWSFPDQTFTLDTSGNLSGCVAHGRGFPPDNIAMYGTSGQEVKLLDGLFLAARSETLLAHEVRFDERFDFHFYDLDFCRQAEARKLRMGTWPISVVHESGGSFDSPAWREAYARYLAKWQS
jgi:hypothetical protein